MGTIVICLVELSENFGFYKLKSTLETLFTIDCIKVHNHQFAWSQSSQVHPNVSTSHTFHHPYLKLVKLSKLNKTLKSYIFPIISYWRDIGMNKKNLKCVIPDKFVFHIFYVILTIWRRYDVTNLYQKCLIYSSFSYCLVCSLN